MNQDDPQLPTRDGEAAPQAPPPDVQSEGHAAAHLLSKLPPPGKLVDAQAESVRRDSYVRASLAGSTILLLAIITLLGFWMADTWEQTDSLLNRIIPVLSLLVGGTVGYYFGKET